MSYLKPPARLQAREKPGKSQGKAREKTLGTRLPRVKREMVNYVNFDKRMRLPALHFQLYDHIPTMTNYETSIISIGVQIPPCNGHESDDLI